MTPPEQPIAVLRLGHRPARDHRLTTHVALTARALGASEVLVSTKDPKLEESIRGVVARFGGPFRIRTGVNWRRTLKGWKGQRVHLTMYGEDLLDALPKVERERPLLVVVGAEKVPGDVYTLADLNIAVGHQPHSEVAALAVFLDRHLHGWGLGASFPGPLVISPTPRGKTVHDARREPKTSA